MVMKIYIKFSLLLSSILLKNISQPSYIYIYIYIYNFFNLSVWNY